MEPSDKDYWRALILYGRQQSTYKVALGSCLLMYSVDNLDKISLNELSEDFLELYVKRLKNGMPQLGTLGRKTIVEHEIEAIELTDKAKEKSLEIIKKQSLNNMVLQRFNVLNGETIPKPFYTFSDNFDYLILNDSLSSILDEESDSKYLFSELNSRWDLLEHAFENLNNIEMLDVDEYLRHIIKKEKRKNLTNLIPFLNGYQRGKCFYCGEDLDDIVVDHVIPYQAIMHNEVWNLVLTHPFCNEQKSDNLPPKKYIEDLIIRNEYLIKSDDPLKDTLIKQLGSTINERKDKVSKEYIYAKGKIGRIWGGTEKYYVKEDPFYKNWVKIFGKKA